ncbi:hypothetical protein HDU81_006129 [Chytriomyces hyalinus]|nr:hypothetical protein HDU81_006129 [Chytriomyces hyalinus]
MLSYDSFSIPADTPEPVVRTSLFALLWRQQQEQQQSFAAVADRLVSTPTTSVPHARSINTPTAALSPQPSEACSPVSVGSPAHAQRLSSSNQSLSPNDPFVPLKHAAVQHQTKRARKVSLRGVGATSEDPHKALDACQLKKLQKAERKKRREMNRKLVCFNCGATSSPIWRRTLDRKNNICNACGACVKYNRNPDCVELILQYLLAGLYFKNHKCHKPVRTAPAVVSPVSLSSPATDASDQLPTPEPASDTFLDDFLNFDGASTEQLAHDASTFLPSFTPFLPSTVAAGQDCFAIPHAGDHAANTLSLEIQQFLQPLAHFPPPFPSEYSAVGTDLAFGGVLWSSQEC